MQKGTKVMPDDLTKLSIDWDATAARWRFQASREGQTWAWQVTPGDFKDMIETMQLMDDELSCVVGAKLRRNINTGDKQ
jgi:hypothetical protein